MISARSPESEREERVRFLCWCGLDVFRSLCESVVASAPDGRWPCRLAACSSCTLKWSFLYSKFILCTMGNFFITGQGLPWFCPKKTFPWFKKNFSMDQKNILWFIKITRIAFFNVIVILETIVSSRKSYWNCKLSSCGTWKHHNWKVTTLENFLALFLYV